MAQPCLLVPVRVFENDATLLATLKNEEANAGTQAGPFLYRGQCRRYDPRVYPPTRRYELDPDSVQIESIIPTDYRGFEDAKRWNPDPNPRYSNAVTALRAVISLLVVQGRLTELGHAIPKADQWFNDLLNRPSGQKWDLLGSIGQHSGIFPTQYLDMTDDVYVALWFATHNFVTGAYSPTGRAIIYRIDEKLLLKAELAINTRYQWKGRDAVRHVSIRDIPPELAQRPSCQKGWSLLGIEEYPLLHELIQIGGIEGFIFIPPAALHLSQNKFTADQIRPGADPILQTFESVRQQGWARIESRDARYVCKEFNIIWGDPKIWSAVWFQ